MTYGEGRTEGDERVRLREGMMLKLKTRYKTGEDTPGSKRKMLATTKRALDARPLVGICRRLDCVAQRRGVRGRKRGRGQTGLKFIRGQSDVKDVKGGGGQAPGSQRPSRHSFNSSFIFLDFSLSNYPLIVPSWQPRYPLVRMLQQQHNARFNIDRHNGKQVSCDAVHRNSRRRHNSDLAAAQRSIVWNLLSPTSVLPSFRLRLRL